MVSEEEIEIDTEEDILFAMKGGVHIFINFNFINFVVVVPPVNGSWRKCHLSVCHRTARSRNAGMPPCTIRVGDAGGQAQSFRGTLGAHRPDLAHSMTLMTMYVSYARGQETHATL